MAHHESILTDRSTVLQAGAGHGMGPGHSPRPRGPGDSPEIIDVDPPHTTFGEDGH